MAKPNTPANVLYTCAKCDGRGTISAFSHVQAGACFACEGTGKVALAPITDAEELAITICNIGRTVNHALAALQDDNRERAEYLLAPIISDLFTVGSDNAREILADIAKGEWFDGATMTQGRANPADAASLRLWVITRGRAMLAAK